MTEQKRRGRPPKSLLVSMTPAELAKDIEDGVRVMLTMPDTERAVAQAYADRVWAGQSPSALRSWRIERVKAALEGQGLPFDGVELPE